MRLSGTMNYKNYVTFSCLRFKLWYDRSHISQPHLLDHAWLWWLFVVVHISYMALGFEAYGLAKINCSNLLVYKGLCWKLCALIY